MKIATLFTFIFLVLPLRAQDVAEATFIEWPHGTTQVGAEAELGRWVMRDGDDWVFCTDKNDNAQAWLYSADSTTYFALLHNNAAGFGWRTSTGTTAKFANDVTLANVRPGDPFVLADGGVLTTPGSGKSTRIIAYAGPFFGNTQDPENITILLAQPERGLATISAQGFMSGADKTKLDSVEAGATANATNAQLRDRSTHTGTQAASTISDFDSAVDARIPAWSFNNSPGRSLVSTAAAANGWQISSTRPATVRYTAQIVTTSTIGGSASGSVVVEIASTNSSNAGDWIDVGRIVNGQALTLAIALQSVDTEGGQVAADVPAGWYVRVRQITTSGSPSFSLLAQQEVTK